MSDDPDPGHPPRLPGALYLMQFDAPIDHIEWDERTNTLLVTTEEGVSRVKFPEVKE